MMSMLVAMIYFVLQSVLMKHKLDDETPEDKFYRLQNTKREREILGMKAVLGLLGLFVLYGAYLFFTGG